MVEYQRIDLGPNRWMAAGGQAFLCGAAIGMRSIDDSTVLYFPTQIDFVDSSSIVEEPMRALYYKHWESRHGEH